MLFAKINKDDSSIKSEEEFWNPTLKNAATDSLTEYNAEDEVIERMRAHRSWEVERIKVFEIFFTNNILFVNIRSTYTTN